MHKADLYITTSLLSSFDGLHGNIELTIDLTGRMHVHEIIVVKAHYGSRFIHKTGPVVLIR